MLVMKKNLQILFFAFAFCSISKSIAQCPNGGTPSAVELVVNGDFSLGNVGFTSSYTYCNAFQSCLYPASTYAVGTDPSYFQQFMTGSDHTTGTGNFMIINGADVANVSIWCQTVAVTPNTDYLFSTWVCSVWPQFPAELQFSINGVNIGAIFTAPTSTYTWLQFFATWNSGSNTTADICIVNQNTAAGGNDFGLDDISFRACGCAPVIANAGQDTSVCKGTSVTLSATGGTNYLWNTTSTSSSISVSPSGTTTYSVKVSNDTCFATDSVTIIINSLPIIDAGTDVSIVRGSSATLNATGGGSYNWYPTSGLNCTDCSNPIANPDSTTTYYVAVTDANGCTNTDSVTVFVYDEIKCGELFVPTAFSPNGDGENEMLYVRGNCIKELQFNVYDRWGEKVFETTDVNKGWDGTYRSGSSSKQLKTGVFVYYLNVTLSNADQITRKGNISLIK